MLSNKTSYGEQGANKYYIAYLSDGLHIIIKNIKFHTDHMNVLPNDNELLKYIEIWNKIKALLYKRLYNEYIKTMNT